MLAGCHTQGPIEVDNGSRNAVLSPDGTLIAFCRYFRYVYKGYQITLDPTPQRNAYEAWFVYTIHRETKEVSKILEHGSHHLSWEGGLIAYNEGPTCDTEWGHLTDNLAPPVDIYVMNPDGTGKTFVVEGNSPFMLLPDATKLIYLAGSSLFSININGTDKTLIRDLSDLLVDAENAGTLLRDMAWDPDASMILIGIMPSDAPFYGIWEMNLDGTGFKKSGHQYGTHFWTMSRGISNIHSHLGELTSDVTYEQWKVPRPEDFD